MRHTRKTPPIPKGTHRSISTFMYTLLVTPSQPLSSLAESGRGGAVLHEKDETNSGSGSRHCRTRLGPNHFCAMAVMMSPKQMSYVRDVAPFFLNSAYHHKVSMNSWRCASSPNHVNLRVTINSYGIGWYLPGEVTRMGDRPYKALYASSS